MAKRSVAELSAEEKRDIAEWYEAGVKTREIEEAFGVGSSVPTLVAREFGLPPRTVRGSSRPVADFETLTLPDPIEHEGEFLIRDLDLGRVLGYRHPRDFRRLIQKKMGTFPENQTTRSLSASWISGNGTEREGTQYLLTEEQAYLVILHCRLPNADAFKALVAKIFTKWRQGKLVSTDAETTIEIQDAVEQFIEETPAVAAVATPDLVVFLNSVSEHLRRMEDKQNEFLKTVSEKALTRPGEARVNISPKDRAIIRRVMMECFGGKCPLNGTQLLDDNGDELKSNEKTLGDYDHMVGAGRAEAHNCWYIERSAHQNLTRIKSKRNLNTEEKSCLRRAKAAFEYFQSRVEAYYEREGTQLSFLG